MPSIPVMLVIRTSTEDFSVLLGHVIHILKVHDEVTGDIDATGISEQQFHTVRHFSLLVFSLY
jgi:hypothetical protein